MLSNKKVLMFSGGKDSTYLIKYCLENGIEVDEYLFCDTTLQLPLVYDWIDYIENYFDIEIRRRKPSVSFEEKFYQVHKKGHHKGEIWGIPRVHVPCWILRDLKLGNMYNRDVIYIIGYTASERDRDLKNQRYIAPLRENNISEFTIINELKSDDLYPPLYQLLEKYGATEPTSGCYLCPRAPLVWYRMLYNEFPEYWRKLKKYVKEDSSKPFRPHYTIEEIERKIKHKNKISSMNSKIDEFL